MRRRIDAKVMPTGIPGEMYSRQNQRDPTLVVISEVPEEWRTWAEARQPWRALFPDLDWKPP